jgi:hypothetical protein
MSDKKLEKICARLKEVPASDWDSIGYRHFATQVDDIRFELSIRDKKEERIVDGAMVMGSGDNARTIMNMRYIEDMAYVRLEMTDIETKTPFYCYEQADDALFMNLVDEKGNPIKVRPVLDLYRHVKNEFKEYLKVQDERDTKEKINKGKEKLDDILD